MKVAQDFHSGLNLNEPLRDIFKDKLLWHYKIKKVQVGTSGNEAMKSQPLLGKIILYCLYQFACLEVFLLQNETTMAWLNSRWSNFSAKLTTNRSALSIAAKLCRRFLVSTKASVQELQKYHTIPRGLKDLSFMSLSPYFNNPRDEGETTFYMTLHP